MAEANLDNVDWDQVVRLSPDQFYDLGDRMRLLSIMGPKEIAVIGKTPAAIGFSLRHLIFDITFGDEAYNKREILVHCGMRATVLDKFALKFVEEHKHIVFNYPYMICACTYIAKAHGLPEPEAFNKKLLGPIELEEIFMRDPTINKIERVLKHHGLEFMNFNPFMNAAKLSEKTH